jgi:hypothetical protein
MLRAPAVEDIPWESVHVAGNVRREFPTDNLCKTFDSLRPSKGASGKVCALSALCALRVGFGGVEICINQSFMPRVWWTVPETSWHGIETDTVVEPSTRANAVAPLDASDRSGSHAMSCRRVVLELHLDLTKDLRAQCALPAQSWSGESERTASDRGEPPAR